MFILLMCLASDFFSTDYRFLVNSPASTVCPFDKSSRKMMNIYGTLAKF